jgi:hypothetical protein
MCTQENLRRAGLILQAVSELREHFNAEDQDTLTALACELIADASNELQREQAKAAE